MVFTVHSFIEAKVFSLPQSKMGSNAGSGAWSQGLANCTVLSNRVLGSNTESIVQTGQSFFLFPHVKQLKQVQTLSRITIKTKIMKKQINIKKHYIISVKKGNQVTGIHLTNSSGKKGLGKVRQSSLRFSELYKLSAFGWWCELRCVHSD